MMLVLGEETCQTRISEKILTFPVPVNVDSIIDCCDLGSPIFMVGVFQSWTWKLSSDLRVSVY